MGAVIVQGCSSVGTPCCAGAGRTLIGGDKRQRRKQEANFVSFLSSHKKWLLEPFGGPGAEGQWQVSTASGGGRRGLPGACWPC